MLLAACVTQQERAQTAAPAPESAPEQMAAATPAPEKPEPPKVEIPGLSGWPDIRVRELMGTPEFIRRDIKSELWRYAGTECLLDLYLYPGATDGVMTVSHIEARDKGGKAAETKDCTADILRLTPPRTG